MQIEVSYEQGKVPVTVFHIEGELTHESYEQLQQQAEDAVAAGSRNLVLDLVDVSYMSSSGLRAIHHIFGLLQTASPGQSDQDVRKGISAGTFKSSHLKLLNPSPEVANVLKMAGFDMFLETYSSLQKAIAAF
jgi:anti-anti-sigma regulatory factor